MATITEAFGVSESTAYKALRDAGVQRVRRNGSRPVSEKDLEIARDYQDSTMKVSEVLAKHDISDRGLTGALRRAGVSKGRYRQARVFTDAEVEDIKTRWFNGESQREIAESYEIPEHTVRTAMRRAGVRHPQQANVARGERHGQWKGGRTMDENGYLLVRLQPDHPHFGMTSNEGYVREHRLVMAQALGRDLTSNETVHHIDGVKTHNHLSNLSCGRASTGREFRWSADPVALTTSSV